MKRKSFVIFTLSLIIICFSSCSPHSVDALEYHQICSEANKDSLIVGKGYLLAADKVPCLKSLNSRRDCAVKLLRKTDDVNFEVMLNLAEGSSKNQLETPESGNPSPPPTTVFSREQVKIRLDDGTIHQSDSAIPVIVTGTVRFGNSAEKSRCTVEVTKIEKGS